LKILLSQKEILDDTLPGYSVKKRIKNYIDLYFSNIWEDATGKNFPTNILVCETMPALLSIKKIARRFMTNFDEFEGAFFKFAIKDRTNQS